MSYNICIRQALCNMYECVGHMIVSVILVPYILFICAKPAGFSFISRIILPIWLSGLLATMCSCYYYYNFQYYYHAFDVIKMCALHELTAFDFHRLILHLFAVTYMVYHQNYNILLMLPLATLIIHRQFGNLGHTSPTSGCRSVCLSVYLSKLHVSAHCDSG